VAGSFERGKLVACIATSCRKGSYMICARDRALLEDVLSDQKSLTNDCCCMGRGFGIDAAFSDLVYW
jgi:hypothetical protein